MKIDKILTLVGFQICLILFFTMVLYGDVGNIPSIAVHSSKIDRIAKLIMVRNNEKKVKKMVKVEIVEHKENTDSVVIVPVSLDVKDYLLGKFKSTKKNDFKKLPLKYTDGRAMFLRSEVADAFMKMADAAKKDGITLKVISAFRSFYHQKSIYEGKYLGRRMANGENLTKYPPKVRIKKIMLYSSMPGTSRHHWGTDMDINSLSSSYFKHGYGKKVLKWELKNTQK